MRVAVTGGTGLAGAAVVAELERRGHEARVLSRRSPTHPVDLMTGSGLDVALAGCDAVIDAANAGPRPGAARAVLVDGCRRLLDAEERAGIGNHVCLSIVGIDDFPLAYYRVKVEQELVVRSGPVPHSILRATQFHEFVAAGFAAAARWRVLPRLGAPLQPVAVAEVAAAAADLVEEGPGNATRNVAGPATRAIGELAASWRASTGARAALVPLPTLGRAGRALRKGALTCTDPDVWGRIGFEEVLAGRSR